MQKHIVPHLWFDTQAKEAAAFYTSLLPNSWITNSTQLHNTPSGDCDTVSFELAGQPFMAISAGPSFKFNPSISFMVNFDPSRDPQAKEHLDAMWERLSDGGTTLMPLGAYPFSSHYGWIQDKYGLTWQLILTNPDGEERPMIIPSIMFNGDVYGKAEEALQFYCSVFKVSQRGTTAYYPKGMEGSKEGTVMFADFKILSTWLTAMDSSGPHEFSFTEAISLLIPCATQEEIDYYWEKLSANPAAEQCGWLKDKFGISWQVYPTMMEEVLKKGTPEQIDRVTQAFLLMKKFDLALLQKAYEGK